MVPEKVEMLFLIRNIQKTIRNSRSWITYFDPSHQYTQPGLGTQPQLQAFHDLQVNSVDAPMIKIGWVRLPPTQWPKVDLRASK